MIKRDMENIAEGERLKVLRRELFDVLRGEGILRPNSCGSRKKLVDYILKKFGMQNASSTMIDLVERVVTTFTISLAQRWQISKRSSKQFLIKHDMWLRDHINIENVNIPSCSYHSEAVKPFGRPQKEFQLSSNKTKRRKLESIIQGRSLEEISFAAEVKLRSSGKKDAAKLLKCFTYSPKRATRMKNAYNFTLEKKELVYSPEEALALITSAKITKSQYLILRQGAKAKGMNIYPSYHLIKKAKKACYPDIDSCIITDKSAEVKLQALVDLTIMRLCKVQSEVLSAFCSNESQVTTMQMIYKWGSDGSGGQSRYKQKASDRLEETELDDSSVLATSVVPLQLSAENGPNKIIIWQNPRTASTRFCRPIRFQFTKETNAATVNEFKYIEDQIAVLRPTHVSVKEKDITVKHTFFKTMVDGKVCNALSLNTYTQQCYICKAKPKDMNNLNLLKERQCDTETYSLGLSTLHAYIRFFECLLHISYRLKIQQWQIRGKENKDRVAERKKDIIDKFRSETGLLVDIPKQGTGNTNDGNTARRFFSNPVLSSEITGIDENLINRFSIILKTLACGFDIDIEKFEKYANETAQLYVNLYSWFPMPVTVHKILIHGAPIITSFLLPIGQLSEEVQESRHKEFKKFREGFSRKTSRKNTNEDIFHQLLISSDPVISNIRPLAKKPSYSLPKEVIFMLKSPSLETPKIPIFDKSESSSDSDASNT